MEQFELVAASAAPGKSRWAAGSDVGHLRFGILLSYASVDASCGTGRIYVCIPSHLLI